MTCSVCGDTAIARELCDRHYRRWRRHGDPLSGGVSSGELLAHFEREMARDTDECLVWPYGTGGSGYGVLRINGKRIGVHVLACERAHGPRPHKHYATHGPCHNTLCFNPRHLAWKTPSENQLDRRRDGTARKTKKKAA